MDPRELWLQLQMNASLSYEHYKFVAFRTSINSLTRIHIVRMDRTDTKYVKQGISIFFIHNSERIFNYITICLVVYARYFEFA